MAAASHSLDYLQSHSTDPMRILGPPAICFADYGITLDYDSVAETTEPVLLGG